MQIWILAGIAAALYCFVGFLLFVAQFGWAMRQGLKPSLWQWVAFILFWPFFLFCWIFNFLNGS